MKLTKTAIETATANGKDCFLWCSELPRFGVRVATSGRKTYVARYRNAAGQSRMVTLARVVDMNLADARALARKVFSSVAMGDDPSTGRALLRSAPTVADLYQRYEREHAQPYKKASTVARDESLWRLHIIPALGTRRVATITTNDIQALHAQLRDIPATANRAVAVLSSAFTKARRWGWYHNANPCADVVRYREKMRERILSRDELARLLAELENPVYAPAFVRLVRLLLLTGARLREIMCARVEWVDWDRGLLLLPDSKTGQKRVGLSSAALALIEPRRGQTWICEGRTGTHFKRPHGAFRRLCAAAGISDFRPHDLRHTVGSYAHQAGLSQAEIMELLGHKHLVTTARYLHTHGRRAENVERVAAVFGLG